MSDSSNVFMHQNNSYSNSPVVSPSPHITSLGSVIHTILKYLCPCSWAAKPQ